jgi:hypothetical protein
LLAQRAKLLQRPKRYLHTVGKYIRLDYQAYLFM